MRLTSPFLILPFALLALPSRGSAQEPQTDAGSTADAGTEAGEATPPPVDQGEAARRAFDEGQAAFDRGDFTYAASEFSIAFQVTGSADVAFNVALSYDQAGDAAQAAAWYRVYITNVPDAPDRAQIEARIAELTSGAPAPPVGPAEGEGEGEGEPEDQVRGLAPHRLRIGVGYGYYPGGALYATGEGQPVDLGAFRLELGYQLALYKGLFLDVLAGGSFQVDVQTSRRTWDLWSAGAGLGWVWTSLPYVNLAVRGDILFYAFVPNVGDMHWLVPFRAGAWIEFPILDWLAIHAGCDFGIGAYVGRDDKVLGFVVEAGGGVTFFFGGDDGEDEPEPDEPEDRPSPRPTLHGTGHDLGPGWQ